MKQNNFSFVAPMYNASKYVGQMLSSVMAQSYDNWNVIIIDDCSSPEEKKKAYAELVRLDPFSKVIRDLKF